MINSGSSRPLMQHTSNNYVHLAGKSHRVARCFLMPAGWHRPSTPVSLNHSLEADLMT